MTKGCLPAAALAVGAVFGSCGDAHAQAHYNAFYPSGGGVWSGSNAYFGHPGDYSSSTGQFAPLVRDRRPSGLRPDPGSRDGKPTAGWRATFYEPSRPAPITFVTADGQVIIYHPTRRD